MPLSTPKKEEPKFSPETVVSSPSLVVDRDGVAWWIDPHARIIRRADAIF